MFSDKTFENIKNDILSSIDLDLAKNEGSILNAWAAGTAVAHAEMYTILEDIYNSAFLVDLTSESLDKRVSEFGISRKIGDRARGYLYIEGVDGTEIEDGTVFLANNKEYTVLRNITESNVIENGTITVFIEAVNSGSEYNLPINAIFYPREPIVGFDNATNNIPISGGTDDESDEELKARFLYQQRHKGTSGNADDYRNWALEVDGVHSARVVPLWNGNGTVKVIVTSADNRNVDQTVVNAAKAYIDSKKPIGATVTVTTPAVVDVNIVATIELLDANIDDVRSRFSEELERYLITATSEITYTKIAGILSRIEGVYDYKDLTVNGGTVNIQLDEDTVGSAKTIEFTEGIVE